MAGVFPGHFVLVYPMLARDALAIAAYGTIVVSPQLEM